MMQDKQVAEITVPTAILILAGGASRRMGQAKALLPLHTYQNKALKTPQVSETLLDYHIRHALAYQQIHTHINVLVADNGQGFVSERYASQVSIVDDFIASNHNSLNSTTNRACTTPAPKSAGALSAIAGAMQVLTDADKLFVVSCDTLVPITELIAEFHTQALDARIQYFITSQKTKHQANNKINNKTDKKTNKKTNKKIETKDYPLLGYYDVSLKASLQAYLLAGNRRVMQFLAQHDAQKIIAPSHWHTMMNVNTPDELAQALTQLSTTQLNKQRSL